MHRNSPFLRMPDHKLRNTKRNYTSSYLSGNTQRHVLDPEVPALRRTTGHRCLGPKSKCGVCITLLMCRVSGDWYLLCNGCLAHVLHVQKHALQDVVSPSKIEDEDREFMQVMYETDVTPAIISRVMQTVCDKKGRKGRILTRNIVNAKQKYRREMDLLLKISSDFLPLHCAVSCLTSRYGTQIRN